MAKIITVFWSGFGHTKRLAEAVHEGAGSVDGVEALLLDAAEYGEASKLDVFDDADAIIFGTPTYMGGPAATFKQFMDAAGQKWLTQAWKDKIAGGFTNSGSPSGDKQGTLMALAVNALQHGMIWVGADDMPAENPTVDCPDPDKVNRLGAFVGVMGKSSSGEAGPSSGDLETGRRYGKRIAEKTLKFRG